MSFPYRFLEDLPDPSGAPPPAPAAVALGVFDGVHRGHQELLAAMLREATSPDASQALLPAVLTFHPHPTALFAPDRVPPLLCTLEERAELLRAYGAGLVVVARFDAVFAGQSPEEFVRHVLTERLRARAVVVGEDFRYGRGRAGDAASLA
ncbi:MAG TPA: hypothetical protein VM490_19760, partial [Armatimonadaceae bacterium]|nr:hypothetical protein [Armatimonadaceae bacterium]